MSPVPDFTEAEQWSVETTLKKRCPDQKAEFQLLDDEIGMRPQDRQLTVCPAIFREVGKTSFGIIHVARKTCRSQFYYRGHQQYGTGTTDYDDITDCVAPMLQVHTDREANNRKESV